MRIFPIILCGGAGERLWPLSRSFLPKQFVSFFGSRSLFQDTLLRVCQDIYEYPIIVCHEEHQAIVSKQLMAMNITPTAIFLEPVRRNTAPAIITASLYAHECDQNAIIMVFPSDHLIKDIPSFTQSVSQAIEVAKKGYLTVFGISPTRAEAGYGYIKKGERLSDSSIVKVEKFIEKPNFITACEYLQTGGYYWNSGMFVFPVNVLLSEAEKLIPHVVTGCRKAVMTRKQQDKYIQLDREAFSAIPTLSVDHGIMEKTDKAALIEASFDWTDLGSYESLWESSKHDTKENAIIGDVVFVDLEACYVHSEGPLIAASGLKDLIIVSTKDFVLVTAKQESQKVKQLVNRLQEEKRLDIVNPSVGHRPWGTYMIIDKGEGFQIKRILVKPGGLLSLQKHAYRSEHWFVIKGVAHVINGSQSLKLEQNESTYIPSGQIHRLENKGPEVLQLIEIQRGEYLGEDDIERFEDIYGRVQEL